MAALAAQPFTLFAPQPPTAPLVFASPHSGRTYPPSFLRQSRLSALALRRSEDAFVDELFCDVRAIGAPMLAARFPRALLDVNRSPAELDATMFDGPLKMPVDATSPRVGAGLGVIPRIVRDGAEIYPGKLSPREAVERLTNFYKPYHAALASLVEAARAKFGVAVLVDCHSMPSAAAIPDIVLGDRYGLSAAPVLMRAAERAFESQGFRVVRNAPYAGGFATQLYGRPSRGTHALQIEINRALYLDEERVEPRAEFAHVAARIGGAIRGLVAIAQELRPAAQAHAAE